MRHENLGATAARLGTYCCLTLAATLGLTAPAVAQIVAIEEDWELVLLDPDADTVAPQISCVMSPTGNTDNFHVAFELNHQTQPNFRPGGLQVQFWNGETPLSNRKFPKEDLLATQDETVRWTQRMTLYGNTFGFEIRNGNSTTWGDFGGEGYLKDSCESNLENLHEYRPSVSVENSGVSYAGNRVARLVLTEIRYYTTQGLVARDTTDRVAHEHQ